MTHPSTPLSGLTYALTEPLTTVLTDAFTYYQQWIPASLLVVDAGTADFDTATTLQTNSAPQALLISLPGRSSVETWLPVGVCVAVGLIVAAIVLPQIARRRALRARDVHRTLLPSPQFDPTNEEVRRFAAVLSRAHRATRIPGTRAAHGVRIRLSATDGLVHWRVEGHHRSQSVLAMAGYDQTENLPSKDRAPDIAVQSDSEDS